MGPRNLAVLAWVFVAIGSAVSQEAGFRCYVCNSLTDGNSDCLDPFVSAPTMENCMQCEKTKYVNEGGINVVVRLCLPMATNIAGCQSQTVENQSADLCHCDTDLCNGAGGFSLSLAILVFPAIVQILRSIL